MTWAKSVIPVLGLLFTAAFVQAAIPPLPDPCSVEIDTAAIRNFASERAAGMAGPYTAEERQQYTDRETARLTNEVAASIARCKEQVLSDIDVARQSYGRDCASPGTGFFNPRWGVNTRELYYQFRDNGPTVYAYNLTDTIPAQLAQWQSYKPADPENAQGGWYLSPLEYNFPGKSNVEPKHRQYYTPLREKADELYASALDGKYLEQDIEAFKSCNDNPVSRCEKTCDEQTKNLEFEQAHDWFAKNLQVDYYARKNQGLACYACSDCCRVSNAVVDVPECVRQKRQDYCWVPMWLDAYYRVLTSADPLLGKWFENGWVKYGVPGTLPLAMNDCPQGQRWLDGICCPAGAYAKMDGDRYTCESLAVPTPANMSVECVLMHGTGDSDNLDILFLQADYPPEVDAWFVAVAESTSKEMFAYAPFYEEASRMNVWMLNGTTQIKCTRGFYAADPEILHCDEERIAAERVRCPNDQVVVIVNGEGRAVAPLRGGDYVLVPSLEPRLSVVTHEFAHSFAGIRDEYTYGTNAPAGQDPPPNCDADSECNNLGGDACYRECSYDDWYRIEGNGMMRDAVSPFGDFNEAILKKKLQRYGE